MTLATIEVRALSGYSNIIKRRQLQKVTLVQSWETKEARARYDSFPAITPALFTLAPYVHYMGADKFLVQVIQSAGQDIWGGIHGRQMPIILAINRKPNPIIAAEVLDLGGIWAFDSGQVRKGVFAAGRYPHVELGIIMYVILGVATGKCPRAQTLYQLTLYTFVQCIARS